MQRRLRGGARLWCEATKRQALCQKQSQSVAAWSDWIGTTPPGLGTAGTLCSISTEFYTWPLWAFRTTGESSGWDPSQSDAARWYGLASRSSQTCDVERKRRPLAVTLGGTPQRLFSPGWALVWNEWFGHCHVSCRDALLRSGSWVWSRCPSMCPGSYATLGPLREGWGGESIRLCAPASAAATSCHLDPVLPTPRTCSFTWWIWKFAWSPWYPCVESPRECRVHARWCSQGLHPVASQRTRDDLLLYSGCSGCSCAWLWRPAVPAF